MHVAGTAFLALRQRISHGNLAMIKALLFLLFVVTAVALFGWTLDAITMQGERTIYTARCDRGVWANEQCTGRLVAAERYRFRVLVPHNEVLFWTVGSAEPSGTFTDCEIKDGRNWKCKANANASRTITLEMSRGQPVPDPTASTRPFHAVSKLRDRKSTRLNSSHSDRSRMPSSA